MCWTPEPGALQPPKADFSLRTPPRASLAGRGQWASNPGLALKPHPPCDCALHRPTSLHRLPWLHLLDSVYFVHLATGLSAQPLYFWKPALSTTSSYPPDIGFLEPFSLLTANLPVLPAPCPQQESQLLPTKSPSQSCMGRVTSP